MKFVSINGKGNVDISFYTVEEIEAKTVGGLLQLIAAQDGFGDITIWNAKPPFNLFAHSHYSEKCSITIPADIANVPFVHVTASGGWGRTDFRIYV